MDALPAFRDLFTPPDPALRQPLTGGAIFLFFSLYYAMAVLAILPHTVIIKLSLLPFVVWQAWRCATGMNFAAGLALAMGNDNGERLNHWNFAYVVRSLSSVNFSYQQYSFFPRYSIDWRHRHGITSDRMGIHEKAVKEIRTIHRRPKNSR